MPPDILIVDDDPGSIRLIVKIVKELGSSRFASNGADALQLAAARPPDLVLLDAEMEGMNGFEVCSALRADPRLADVPIIFVTSHRDESFEVRGFESGASDFIMKPVNAQLVRARAQAQLRVKRMSDELKRQATVDPLTELPNRRVFDETLPNEWRRARRSGGPLSLLMVDVDHFKAYNDHYGHPAGDACLRRVAAALRGACRRPADVPARFGGEEFAAILPETDAAGAREVAQRVLDGVVSEGIPHARSSTLPVVSASVGCATFGNSHPHRGDAPEGGVTWRELLSTADEALYGAKTGGRAHARLCELLESRESGRASREVGQVFPTGAR